MNGFRRAQLTITAVTNAAVINGLVVIAQLNFFERMEMEKKKLSSHKNKRYFFPFFLNLIHHCPNMGVCIIGLAQCFLLFKECCAHCRWEGAKKNDIPRYGNELRQKS
jgi:hypothetical protein